MDRDTGRVFLNGSLNAEANDEKFYLRLRATDRAGHITESQLVIHVLKEQETPPIVRGLAVIDGNYVTLGQDGNDLDILAVVMEQLVERSLPLLKVRGSNPVIGKLLYRIFVYCQQYRKDKIKKERPRMAHFKNKIDIKQ